MKKLLFFFASVAMLGVASCDGNGKTGANTGGQDTDSLTEEDLKVVDSNVAPGLVGDSSFVGIICDGTSQNVLVMYSTNSDGEKDTTTFILSDDADKSNFHGIVEGAPCEVVFSGDLKDKPKVTCIETYATYTNAIGRWTCEDPENKDKKIGVEFLPKGKASSNMARFKAIAWQMYDDRARTIFITVDNKGVLDDVTAQISEDGKTLTIERDAKVYTKEEDVKAQTKEQ